MTPQLAPNRWSCLPTAFAVVLNQPVQEIIRLLGHNGSEIVWPQFSEPLCRRGFHIQELIFVAWRNFSRTVTPFEAIPLLRSGDGDPVEVPTLPEPHWRMPEIMAHNSGVLTGKTYNGQPHAVAWDGELVLDCDDAVYEISKFRLECFWMVK